MIVWFIFLKIKLIKSTVKKRILKPDSGRILKSIMNDVPGLVGPVSTPDTRLKRQNDVRSGASNESGEFSAYQRQQNWRDYGS